MASLTVGAQERRAGAREGPIRVPPVGFWSYARQDDELSGGKLTVLRSLLMAELQQQFGRERIQLFQDVTTIPHGASWEQEIRASLSRSTFLIPIITPNFIQSEWCCSEVAIFLDRQAEIFSEYPGLPCRSRIFPLHFIDVEGIDPCDAQVVDTLEQLQWFDFRHLRHRNYEDESVRFALSKFAASIRDLLHVRIARSVAGEEDGVQNSQVRARAAAEEAMGVGRNAVEVDNARPRPNFSTPPAPRRPRLTETFRMRSGWFWVPPAVILFAALVFVVLFSRTTDPASPSVSENSISRSVEDKATRQRQPAPIQKAPDWLLGRWGVEGDCSVPVIIASGGSGLSIDYEGERHARTIRVLTGRTVVTEHESYMRSGNEVLRSEMGVPSYRMVRC